MDKGQLKIGGDAHEALAFLAGEEGRGRWPRARDIVAATNIATATVYSLLGRLVEAELVEPHFYVFDKRPHYRLTAAGIMRLGEMNQQQAASAPQGG